KASGRAGGDAAEAEAAAMPAATSTKTEIEARPTSAKRPRILPPLGHPAVSTLPAGVANGKSVGRPVSALGRELRGLQREPRSARCRPDRSYHQRQCASSSLVDEQSAGPLAVARRGARRRDRGRRPA